MFLNDISGLTDVSWVTNDALDIGDEVAILQRRVSHLFEALTVMAQVPLRARTGVQLADVFRREHLAGIIGSDADVTNLSQAAFQSFPTSWTSTMMNIYQALSARRKFGRGVNLSELSGWLNIPCDEVFENIRALAEARMIESVDGQAAWRCT